MARSILMSQKKRLNNDELYKYDVVIREQLECGVIEPVSNVNKRADVSYIAHSAVFRQNAESTKLRVVYLSNLKAGKSKLSHNQISMPGANLNNKLQIATLLLRFDKVLLTFDLEKAFLQLLIRKEDSDRLLFLWFKNVAENDFSIETYRIRRVPFGMRYSPFLLMISLYYILVYAAEGDSDFVRKVKLALYDLAYVDNLAFTSDDENEIKRAICIAKEALGAFKFNLQQYASNSASVNEYIEAEVGEVVNTNTKLFGLEWNTRSDTIACKKLFLDNQGKD